MRAKPVSTEDHGGSLDVDELRHALKTLQDSAKGFARNDTQGRERASVLRQLADQAKQAADATRQRDRTEKKLEELIRGNDDDN